MLIAVLGPMIIPCKHNAHDVKTIAGSQLPSTIHMFLMMQVLLALPASMAAMLYLACLNSRRHAPGMQN